MAYARPIDLECSEGGCVKRATYEVRNGSNALVRHCCQRHAEALVRTLSEEEDARRG